MTYLEDEGTIAPLMRKGFLTSLHLERANPLSQDIPVSSPAFDLVHPFGSPLFLACTGRAEAHHELTWTADSLLRNRLRKDKPATDVSAGTAPGSAERNCAAPCLKSGLTSIRYAEVDPKEASAANDRTARIDVTGHCGQGREPRWAGNRRRVRPRKKLLGTVNRTFGG